MSKGKKPAGATELNTVLSRPLHRDCTYMIGFLIGTSEVTPVIAVEDARYWVHIQEGTEWDEYASAQYVDELAETTQEALTLAKAQAEASLPPGTPYVFRVFAVSLIDERKSQTDGRPEDWA